MNFSSPDSSQYGPNTTTDATLADTHDLHPTAGHDVTSGGNIATTMANDVTDYTSQSTTALHDDDKVPLVTDMQLHFIIVGGLFVVVVILALINLYIHYKTNTRSHGFEAEDGRITIKSSYGRSSTGRKGGGYTMKMKAKPSLFI